MMPGPHARANIVGIAGIGASAGGLEALTGFLKQVPDQTGLAWIVVQHLPTDRKNLLPELLQRATPLPVVQAGQNMPVKADHVYVNPPNHDLSLHRGRLQLTQPDPAWGKWLPIDHLFRSLAQDQQTRAIGIILSGMGADGTQGLKAIREHGGLTLAQTPESARYDAMPRSAVEAGFIDIIAPEHELPGRILAHLQHNPHPGQTASAVAIESPPPAELMEAIIALLRERSGHDFSHYKQDTLTRRVERRMGLHGLDTLAAYVRLLAANPQETELLFREMLIGVTQFFREKDVWERLRYTVFPQLFAASPGGSNIRAWVPACSTGEEAYSLAITFREALTEQSLGSRYTLQIFATDINFEAIQQARQGLYPASIAADVSAERLRKFFTEEGNGYRIHKEIREQVIFAPQNLIMDPPFTRLDILSCRNLLIYLEPELQKKLIALFHYALRPDGILILGHSESVGRLTDLFHPLDARTHLYARTELPGSQTRVNVPRIMSEMMTPGWGQQEGPCNGETTTMNLQTLADRFLLQHYTPAAVLLNPAGDILYISGRTGKYLEPAAGKANWNIHAMARAGFRLELAIALKEAAAQPPQPIQLKCLPLERTEGSPRVDLTVHAIQQPESLKGMVMVIFQDHPTVSKSRRSGSCVERSLREQMEHSDKMAQMLLEEMHVKQEELKSTIEALQSANEELQSTNEELTTTKEEMQSLNEELQTINFELETKVTDLSSVNNDMSNLLNITEIATIFLDTGLNIRRYTEPCTRLFKLIPADQGRPLSDIVSELQYPRLYEDTAEVLRSLAVREAEIPTHDQRWFKVRIMPYRTQTDIIDGVVLTFTDITDSKKLEATLQQANP